MTLSIDASDPLKVKLGLDGQIHFFETDYGLSERLIPEIKEVLQRQKAKINNITKIEVAAGPGPFSRIRTAVATANALVYALGLPQKTVKPIYGRAAHITKPKSSSHLRGAVVTKQSNKRSPRG